MDFKTNFEMNHLKICAVSGSTNIGGRVIKIPKLTWQQCLSCGEEFFGSDVMEVIESQI
jgi:hypothetical protein